MYTKFSRFTKTSFHMKGDYEVGERCTSYLINIFIACNCNGSCKMNNKSSANEKKIKFDYFTFCKKGKKKGWKSQTYHYLQVLQQNMRVTSVS